MVIWVVPPHKICVSTTRRLKRELEYIYMWVSAKVCVDAKLICKHKGLIPDSNVKACQPI